jgi:hypothetical protein
LVFQSGIPCKLDNILNEYKELIKEEYILSCYRKYVSTNTEKLGRNKTKYLWKFVYVGNHLKHSSSGNLKIRLSFKGIKLTVSGWFDYYLKTEKT